MVALMAPQSLFLVAVVGLLAGAVARALLGRRGSTFTGLGLGLAGAALGTGAAALLGLPLNGLAALALAALCGSTAVLALTGLAFRR